MKVVVAGGATAGAAAALLLARAGARGDGPRKGWSRRARSAPVSAWPTTASPSSSRSSSALPSRPSLCPVASSRASSTAPAARSSAPPGPPASVWMVRRSDLQGLLLDALSAEPRVVLAPRRRGRARNAGRPGGRPHCGARTRSSPPTSWSGQTARARGSAQVVVLGAQVAPPGIAYLRALVSTGPALGEEAWTAAGLFGSFALADGVYVYASAGSRRTREAIAARDPERSPPPGRRLYLAVGHSARRRRALRGSRHSSSAAGRLCMLARRPARAGGRRRVRDGTEPRPGRQQRAGRRRRAARRAAPRRDSDGRIELPTRRRRPAVRRVAAAAACLGALAEWTHPLARRVRDRFLMPLASRLARPSDLDRILQEHRETLLAIGRG